MEKFDWPVVGHAKIQQILQKSLVNNKLAHAYLFAGPAHLGKTLMAEKFIASILCQDNQAKTGVEADKMPCEACVFCQQLAKGIHPDVFTLKKEADKKNISIEQVREMQKFLSLSSFLNSYKIALVESAQDLSESAQNGLLKILEEPTPKTILILLANDDKQLLSTISSRCQLLKFRPLSEEDIFHYLVKLGANREQSKILTALVCGQIGLAIDYLKNPELYNSYMDKTRQVLNCFESNLIQKFKYLESLSKGTKGSNEAVAQMAAELDNWQLILRDMLFVQNNLDNLLVNIHFKPEIKNMAGHFTANRVINLLNQLKQTKQYLYLNINPRLAVENLLINF